MGELYRREVSYGDDDPRPSAADIDDVDALKDKSGDANGSGIESSGNVAAATAALFIADSALSNHCDIITDDVIVAPHSSHGAARPSRLTSNQSIKTHNITHSKGLKEDKLGYEAVMRMMYDVR